ncbi:MAG: L-histidine N(alpha)-methyltransferase [Terracidiphilus sp.]|jgi:hypothetical protein
MSDTGSVWSQKFKLYQRLLNVQSNRSVVYSILWREKDQDLAERVYANVVKWVTGRSTPSYGAGIQEFFNGLAEELKCEPGVNGSTLIEATIAQTVAFLGPEERAVAAHMLRVLETPLDQTESQVGSSPVVTTSRNLDMEGLGAIWLQHTGPIQTIASGLAEGRIDQKHYYLDPESSDAWSRIIDAQSYPTYDHCLMSLRALFESPEWIACVERSKPTTSVMLAGGGAPAKDLLFLRNLTKQDHGGNCNYHYLIDISLYMLRYSAMWLCGNAAVFNSFRRKVVLKPVHRDILSFNKRDHDRFHEHGAVVFAITGGTIGNLSEAAFFRSLDQVAAHRDLLVMSADTIDDLSLEDQHILVGKYDNQDLRLWLKPVVRGVLSESESSHPESLERALRRIKVHLRSGEDGHVSDIPQSRSVVVTLDVNGREVILLTSTRYQTSQLSAYAASHGWECLGQISTQANPHFKQFLFLRT